MRVCRGDLSPAAFPFRQGQDFRQMGDNLTSQLRDKASRQQHSANRSLDMFPRIEKGISADLECDDP